MTDSFSLDTFPLTRFIFFIFIYVSCLQVYDFITHFRVGVVQTDKKKDVLFRSLISKSVNFYMYMSTCAYVYPK